MMRRSTGLRAPGIAAQKPAPRPAPGAKTQIWRSYPSPLSRHPYLVTRISSLVLQSVSVIAPALPRPALVFADRFILQHATHQRGDVGFVALGAPFELPFLAQREYRRFQDFS